MRVRASCSLHLSTRSDAGLGALIAVECRLLKIATVGPGFGSRRWVSSNKEASIEPRDRLDVDGRNRPVAHLFSSKTLLICCCGNELQLDGESHIQVSRVLAIQDFTSILASTRMPKQLHHWHSARPLDGTTGKPSPGFGDPRGVLIFFDSTKWVRESKFRSASIITKMSDGEEAMRNWPG
jgi:hypothetical protein